MNVAKTFALSYDQLDPSDQEALALLARAAYFAPGEPIPRDLLIETMDPEAVGQENNKSTEQHLQTADALNHLHSLGLLERESDGEVKLHRLLAAFTQSVQTGAQPKEDVEQTCLVKARLENRQGYPATLLVWQTHLRFVADHIQKETGQAANLANETGFHLNSIAGYNAAKPYFERALAIREKVLGPEHPYSRTVKGNLQVLLDR